MPGPLAAKTVESPPDREMMAEEFDPRRLYDHSGPPLLARDAAELAATHPRPRRPRGLGDLRGHLRPADLSLRPQARATRCRRAGRHPASPGRDPPVRVPRGARPVP